MNRRWITEIVREVDAFERGQRSIEQVQLVLQERLNLLERTDGYEAYGPIDVAENELEYVLHARLEAEQRDEAGLRLQELREQLVGILSSMPPP